MDISKLSEKTLKVVGMMALGHAILHGTRRFVRGATVALTGSISNDDETIKVTRTMAAELEASGIELDTYQHNVMEGWKTVVPSAQRLALLDLLFPQPEAVDVPQMVVQCLGFTSSQDWAADPTMAVLSISQGFLTTVEKSMAFMEETNAHEVHIWWAFDHSFFEEDEDDEDEDLGPEVVRMVGEDGKRYRSFEPEYALDMCNAKILRNGDIRAIWNFEHTSDTLSCLFGNYADLKAKYHPETVQAAV